MYISVTPVIDIASVLSRGLAVNANITVPAKYIIIDTTIIDMNNILAIVIRFSMVAITPTSDAEIKIAPKAKTMLPVNFRIASPNIGLATKTKTTSSAMYNDIRYFIYSPF